MRGFLVSGLPSPSLQSLGGWAKGSEESGPPSKPEETNMLSISREFAARSSKRELDAMLKRLFNKLAEDNLDAFECRCCHASMQVVRTELYDPAR